MDHFCYLCFMFVCQTVVSFRCSLVVTCWESSLVCVAFLYFVTFPYGALSQVWSLTVSIPDLCLLSYFSSLHMRTGKP